MHTSRSVLSAFSNSLNARQLNRLLLVVAACTVLLLVSVWFSLSSARDNQPRLAIAESLLSGDERVGRLEKVDSSGRFQRYEGVTVIMAVNTSLDSAAYQKAHDLIYNLFGGIISPLPVDSYHVTLTSIAARAKAASLADYNQLLTDNRPRLEAVKWQLKNNAAQQHGVAFTVAGARLGAKAVSLTLHPSTYDDENELRKLNSLMYHALGKLFQRQPRWHLSVGYRRLGLAIEPDEFAPLEAALMDIFASIEVVVTPPVLSAFYDMRQFRPL